MQDGAGGTVARAGRLGRIPPAVELRFSIVIGVESQGLCFNLCVEAGMSCGLPAESPSLPPWSPFTHTRVAPEPPVSHSFRIAWLCRTYHVHPIMTSISISKPVGRMAPQARSTYLNIFAIIRRQELRLPISHAQRPHSSGTYHRSDFTNQSYTGVYDAGAATEVRRILHPAH